MNLVIEVLIPSTAPQMNLQDREFRTDLVYTSEINPPLLSGGYSKFKRMGVLRSLSSVLWSAGRGVAMVLFHILRVVTLDGLLGLLVFFSFRFWRGSLEAKTGRKWENDR